MITGLTVISAVCRKIHAAFPDVPVYREHIGENFAEPSFFVWTESVDISPFEPRKDKVLHHIEVHYFPKHDNTDMYAEMLNIGVQLIETLKSIEIEVGEKNLPVWAIMPTYRIIDDNMLSFSAQYRIETYIAEKAQPLMAELDEEVGVKQRIP